jgi:hypothetical protein
MVALYGDDDYTHHCHLALVWASEVLEWMHGRIDEISKEDYALVSERLQKLDRDGVMVALDGE